MYADALAWLQESGLGQAARGSGGLFAAVNVLHVLGASLLVGGIAVFDLKVLANRGEGVAGIARFALPVAALGLLVQVPTGLVLLAAEARAVGVNPAFLAKLALIGIGLANVAVFHARFGRALRWGTPLPASALPLAAISLGAWSLALVAGRMIAYV